MLSYFYSQLSLDKITNYNVLYRLWITDETTYHNNIIINNMFAAHEKRHVIAYADNEGPDQTAHPCSLIRAFIVRLQSY